MMVKVVFLELHLMFISLAIICFANVKTIYFMFFFKQYLKYIIIFLLIIIISSNLVYLSTTEAFAENDNTILIQNNKNGILYTDVPKKIYTFWDGELTPLVKNCIGSWRKYNPRYEIVVLNKKKIELLIPFFNLKHNNIERYSDMVRLEILAKYGGIWMDASIVCYKPIDWIREVQQKHNVEFVGFYSSYMTIPEFMKTSPVIESWCFACTPQSKLMMDWLEEFKLINKFSTLKEYLGSLDADLQNLAIPEYLTVYASLQEVLQRKRIYSLFLFDAGRTGYKPQLDYNWDSEKISNDLINHKYTSLSFVKLRQGERKALERKNFSDIFI
jgi:hypothetical protein